MSLSFRLARIFGTDVKIHATFLLLLGWFWYTAEKEGGVEAAGLVTLFLLALFACILLHEFGHILMARHFGIRTPDVILLPIGGVARLERMPEIPRQELLIALAGPLVTLLIAVGLYAYLHFTGQDPHPMRPSPDPSIPEALLYSNTMLLLFNLVPAFPLDGGRVLRALLSMKLPHVRATKIAARIGQAAALIGGTYGIWQQEYLWAAIALFIYLTAGQEARFVAARGAVRARKVEEVMNTRLSALAEEATIGQVLPVLSMSTQDSYPILDAERRVIGNLNRDRLIRGMAEQGPAAPISGLVDRVAPTLTRGQNLEEALGALQESGRGMLPVVDDAGRLVGFFTAVEVGALYAGAAIG